MKNIGQVLEDVLKKLPEAQKKIKGFRTEEFWKEIESSGRSRVYNYSNGTVFVETDNPSFAQELSFSKKQMIERLNRLIGEPLVKDLRIRIASITKIKEQ